MGMKITMGFVHMLIIMEVLALSCVLCFVFSCTLLNAPMVMCTEYFETLKMYS